MNTRQIHWVWRGALAVAVSAGGWLSFGPATAEAAPARAAQATCYIQNNQRWTSAGRSTLGHCAVDVAAAGAQAGKREIHGKWGAREFIVKNSGAVLWASTNVSAGRVPDVDSDSIRYDACPREAETANNVFDTDGCPDTLQDLMDLVGNDLNAFWEQRLDGYTPPSAVTSYTRHNPVRTGCGRSISNNAFYCPVDEGIYYDTRFLERMLPNGDFGPVVVLAHEWGHFIQDQAGLYNRYSIHQELQADCLAGAYAGYLRDGQSALARLDEGDIEEGAQLIYLLGDPRGTPWNDPDAHGAPQQRYEAFHQGLDGGITACVENA
jgi:hypothetical protein